MNKYTDYDVFCDDEWVAGSTDLDVAMAYAHQYREDGRVEVYKIKKEQTLVAKMSSLKKKEKND